MKRSTQFGKALLLTVMMVALLSMGGMAEELLLSQDEVDALYENISSVTGLAFKEFPPIEVISKANMMGILFTELTSLPLNDEVDTTIDSMIMLYQIYGKYSWLTKTIYLIEDDLKNAATTLKTDAKTAQKLILTHEMVHALDDQYYGLRNLLIQCKDRESIIAIGALIEGHAVYVARQVYEHIGLDPDAFDPIWNSATGINTLGEAYYTGLRFVSQVLTQPGMTEEQLFARPPLSTHYILNPDLYIQKKPILGANLSTLFGDEYYASWPLDLHPIYSMVGDKMTFYLSLKYIGDTQNLIDGFVTSYICQMQPEIAGQQWSSSTNFLSFTVIQLSTPEYAKKYHDLIKDFNIKQWEKLKQDQEFTGNYPRLTAVYPTSFLNELGGLEDTIQATYFLNVFHEQYLVELVLTDIEISEIDLLRIIADIEQRLSQAEITQL